MTTKLPEPVWTIGLPLIGMAVLWAFGSHGIANLFAMMSFGGASYLALVKWALPWAVFNSEAFADATYFIFIFFGAIPLSIESLCLGLFKIDAYGNLLSLLH